MDKDIKKLIKAAQDAGYDVRVTKRGHITIGRDGRRITTLPGTPSDRPDDAIELYRRSLANALAPLRRDGFQWPPRR